MRQETIGWANGISFDTGTSRLIFDPTSGRPLGETWNVFVTHAHSDHTYGFTTHAKKHSTPETLRIYESLQNRQVKNSHTLKLGDAIRIDDVEVRVIDAGHMLGSCQFEVVTPEFTGVYTGDINCVETLTTQAAQVKQCDYLIIEATYGHPSYVFPQRSTIYADIIRWTTTELKEGKIPTFQVYSSGKPQDLVRLFNVYTKVPVVCSPGIARANNAHAENGVPLDFLDSSTGEGKQALKAGGCIYVTTGSEHMPRNASRAVATGWALRMAFRHYAAFPLSSHADYSQLLQFVSSVNPKRVYVFTGYTDLLPTVIERKLGIKASPLPVVAQTKLLDFKEVVT
ncbi:MAG: MBL fold metallo-hydrolase [Candidatus Bathyarchaeia archaeon]